MATTLAHTAAAENRADVLEPLDEHTQGSISLIEIARLAFASLLANTAEPPNVSPHADHDPSRKMTASLRLTSLSLYMRVPFRKLQWD